MLSSINVYNSPFAVGYLNTTYSLVFTTGSTTSVDLSLSTWCKCFENINLLLFHRNSSFLFFIPTFHHTLHRFVCNLLEGTLNHFHASGLGLSHSTIHLRSASSSSTRGTLTSTTVFAVFLSGKTADLT